jgi:membrane peptidoglycan carboxypeptidase
MFKLARAGGETESDARSGVVLNFRKTERRRVRRIVAWVLFVGILTALVTAEMRTSWLQSRLLAAFAKRLTFELKAGPSPAIGYPADGPYDQRLGHASLPAFQARLRQHGFGVSAQARWSEQLRRIRGMSLFPVYAEKSQAGLRILDRREQPIFARSYPERVYARFEDIPPVIVKSLLLIENRELLDAWGPHRNPAVEWDRLAKAVLDLGVRQVSKGHPISGGSTLATQLEKVRHSPEGRTATVKDKGRQMASASLRSYLDGESTLAARKRILRDYVNGLPLASLPGYGEVAGLGDGLWAWYGADFGNVNKLLTLSENASTDPRQIQAQALAYRQVLSLLLAVKKPSKYLLEDREGLDTRLDSFLPLLAKEGVIGPRLRDATLAARPGVRHRLDPAEPHNFTARKSADAVRVELMRLLGLKGAYDLDRLDLTVRTTLDAQAGGAAGELLKQLADPSYAASAGITGEHLLSPDALESVVYSFTLYERTPGANLLRVQVDNLDQPLNINQGTKLELGSTAKLRTLMTYLEIVEELHREYSATVTSPAEAASLNPRDNLSEWAIAYLGTAADRSLAAMLEAAMNRTYSASPGEAFFTGGGLHVFSNFDPKDDHRVLTVREAFQRSVNLVFIRVMRDLVGYELSRGPGDDPGLLADGKDPRRARYLSQFADLEGKSFLRKFYEKYQGQTPDEALRSLLGGVRPTPRRLATIYRSVRPQASLGEFAAFLKTQPPADGLQADDLVELYSKYGPDKFDLNDRGYLAGVHPLELWLLEYLGRNPGANLAKVLEASAAERQEVYRWLFKNGRKHAQDMRIRTLLEVEAFERIHRRWQRLGYPFPALVPSYATAIGSSGDNPAALSDLVGILLNDGVRQPAVQIQQLHFAVRTPFETIMDRKTSGGDRVMSPVLAHKIREEMLGVVAEGTGRRAFHSVVLSDGSFLQVGGKTGTGDNRIHIYARGGDEIGSKATSRTAAFVFFIGDRFFGTVVAFVPGEEAGSYKFTSALPVQVFTRLMAGIRPLFDGQVAAPEQRQSEQRSTLSAATSGVASATPQVPIPSGHSVLHSGPQPVAR